MTLTFAQAGTTRLSNQSTKVASRSKPLHVVHFYGRIEMYPEERGQYVSNGGFAYTRRSSQASACIGFHGTPLTANGGIERSQGTRAMEGQALRRSRLL